jgi:uncharacterized protein (DUF736 family)
MLLRRAQMILLSGAHNRYLSVQLDSPTCSAKIYCALVQTTNGWELKCERKKPRADREVENAKSRNEA